MVKNLKILRATVKNKFSNLTVALAKIPTEIATQLPEMISPPLKINFESHLLSIQPFHCTLDISTRASAIFTNPNYIDRDRLRTSLGVSLLSVRVEVRQEGLSLSLSLVSSSSLISRLKRAATMSCVMHHRGQPFVCKCSHFGAISLDETLLGGDNGTAR